MVLVNKVPCMNPGTGPNSYSSNSSLQESVIMKARPVMVEAIKEYAREVGDFPRCFRIADLGCSSGPNTLLAITNILDTIEELCQHHFKSPPAEFQVFLNDLPDNDFNNIFKLLPIYYDNLSKEKKNQNIANFSHYFIAGMPGSFYDRLFPANSLHFVHSSYSVHWLSQAPEGVGDNNKRYIYIGRETPADVKKAYFTQFEKDFTKFLRARGEEMVRGGRMVLTLVGRSVEDPSTKDDSCYFTIVGDALLDMVSQGLMNEEDVATFNMPVYHPCKEEVMTLISKEGSFNLIKLESTFEVNWDVYKKSVDDQEYVLDQNATAKAVTNSMRALMEPMMSAQFGDSVISAVFARSEKQAIRCLESDKISLFTIVISLVKV